MAVPHGIDRSGAAGGTGAPGMLGALGDLVDPAKDAIIYWDDSAGDFVFIGFTGGDTPTTGATVVGDGTNWVGGVSNAILVQTIELGHATDTTVSRASAGDINVEANIVYRAGGTDVAIADGGTGASTAAAALSALSGVTLSGLSKFISGFTYANNAVDATNDVDIALGTAIDATGSNSIVGAALTKQLDAAWAVGTNAGGLDTGAIGNSDYYIWVIKRSDTNVVDYLFSLSSTAPTMPTSYDFRRLIGWFKRVGGTIVAFTTYETEGGGIELAWKAPTVDINIADTLTTSRRTDAVKVPLNFSTIANLRYQALDAASQFNFIICCPDETDAAPAANTAPLQTDSIGANIRVAGTTVVRTSAAGLIAERSNLATVDEFVVLTIGFTWARRN